MSALLRLIGSALMGAGLFCVGTSTDDWGLLLGICVFGIGHGLWHEGRP